MLSRQQIRERKRQLQKVERQKRDNTQSLAELNDAERLIEQRKTTRDQMLLQRGDLAVAIVSQVPEHKAPGVSAVIDKAVSFLDLMMDQSISVLTETDEPENDDEDDDDDDEDEPLAAAS